MKSSLPLASVLAVLVSTATGSAQDDGQPSIAFLDPDGQIVYRIAQDPAVDARALQRALWISRLYQRFDAHSESSTRAAEAKALMRSRWAGLGAEQVEAIGSGAPARTSARAARATAGSFTIVGDFSSVFVSGTFVMFQPVDEASGGATMTGAATMGAVGGGEETPEDRLPGEIARAELVDGRCTVEGEVDHVHPVYFYVLDARTADGRRMAPTKGQGFLLEPGRLRLTMNAQHKHTVAGGYFNDAVYGSWQQTSVYQDLQTLMSLAFRSPEGESDNEREAFREIGIAIQNALFDVETDGRKRIALEHPDPLVRQLAIETAWLGGPWMLQGAREILALDPDNAWAKAFVEREESRMERRGRNLEAAGVGSDYLPFAAESLDGGRASLSEVCNDNRYVLLEFWASWCGPCRAEVPHLKAAYELFHDRGFEIFGYTLDDSREAWAKASREEGLPWIDTGFGAKSDPVLLYSVVGVPANYLIDGSTGKVVARNLRGNALEDKLEQLIGRDGE